MAETLLALLGGLTGPISLAIHVYDRIIARPKLEIDAARAFTRLSYTPESWGWAPHLAGEAETCKPHGAVISIPVANRGRRPAEDCKAKLRFRRGGQGEWSRWLELHWADNPEDDLEHAYKPQTIAPREEAYIDVIAYHTRNPPPQPHTPIE